MRLLLFMTDTYYSVDVVGLRPIIRSRNINRKPRSSNPTNKKSAEPGVSGVTKNTVPTMTKNTPRTFRSKGLDEVNFLAFSNIVLIRLTHQLPISYNGHRFQRINYLPVFIQIFRAADQPKRAAKSSTIP